MSMAVDSPWSRSSPERGIESRPRSFYRLATMARQKMMLTHRGSIYVRFLVELAQVEFLTLFLFHELDP